MTPKRFSQAVRGFTLIETMAALAVSSILAAVGVPQFSGLIGAQAADASVADLATALHLARSEAMKRGETVTLCARDPKVAEPNTACVPSGKDWSAGWIIFVDRGQHGQLDDGDVLLQVHQPSKNAPQVLATLRYISFQASGISLSAASHFDFLPHGQVDAPGAHRACINKPGRLRKLDSVTDCAA